MARAARSTALFAAIATEGALIAPAVFAEIAAGKARGQQPADYAVPKGLALRDEIARFFRIGQAHYADLSASPTPSAHATIRFTESLLRDVFGFPDVSFVGTQRIGERSFAVTLEALKGRVPAVVVPPEDDLDRPSLHLPSEGPRRSAASAIQEWLNVGEGALWGLCCNGERFRLVRRNENLTRPAFIEAEIKQIFEDELFSDFAALWLLVHASRFGVPGTQPEDCALESWREEGARAGLAARERLGQGVEAALLALGNGFLADPRNAGLRGFLASGELLLGDFFGQLLRLVYRLIFLFVAEDRGLLHAPDAAEPAKRLYSQGYSVARLRERTVRRTAWDRHDDLWRGLKITFKALAKGEVRLGLPGLGGLFDLAMIPSLENSRLENRPLMEVIYRLAWLKDDSALFPVDWRHMETEELGSVYEGLLELSPQLADEGRAFRFAEGAEGKGHARKTTGSYYTPDSLVQALLDSALEPVLDRVEAEAEDTATALLGVTVLDPACGSGHFLLSAARRIAIRVARARAGPLFPREQYRHALREVVSRCIHGVDRNPMAVELTKVALWIESVDPGKPLGFLDANIRCGDSLFGVFAFEALREGIPDAAFKALTGDDKEAARRWARRNRDEREGQGSFDFAAGRGRFPPPPIAALAEAVQSLPEETLEDIAEKDRRFQATFADPQRAAWRLACDLCLSAFLAPKTADASVPTTATVWQALSGKDVPTPLAEGARKLASAAHAFHWPLEFPEVMERGGFDVVLGNPPWEVVQLGEEEYFAQRSPEIADLAGEARKHAIAALATERPALFAEYQVDKRRSDANNEFARACGRFDLTARGKINTYALFAELFATLASRRGRSGMVVPTGLATSDTTRLFFADLVNGNRLVSFLNFFEIRKIFPGTDDRNPFGLLTIGRGTMRAQFAFYLDSIGQLVDAERRFHLSAEDIARINPDTKTAPVFRSRADADLATKLYGTADRNERPAEWLVLKQNVFTSSSEADLGEFARAATSEQNRAALFRGSMIHQYDDRFATFTNGDFAAVSPAAKQPHYEVESDKHVSLAYYLNRMESKSIRIDYHLAIRRIARSADERTMICAMLPRVGTDDTASIIVVRRGPSFECALLANLNSIPLDYACTLKVGGADIRKYNFSQLPILGPASYTPADLAFIVPRVLELTYTSHALAPFARDLGYNGPPFRWDENQRARLRAELDAWYARAYGLSRDELRYVLDPADVKGPDYPSETFRVLKKNEKARFGEYRTARLVLEAWDAQESDPNVGGLRRVG